MNPTKLVVSGLALLSSIATCMGSPAKPSPVEGTWNATLSAPGRTVPFTLVIAERGDGKWAASVRNASETIEIPVVSFDGATLQLGFDYYDSAITATLGKDGGLSGAWKRRRGPEEWASMDFGAVRAPAAPGAGADAAKLVTHGLVLNNVGRWDVKFADDPDPAVLILKMSTAPSGTILPGEATILTPTGDFRYLRAELTMDYDLDLSCFDGVHAFHITGHIASDGSITGDFYSGAKSHATWTAKPNSKAALADGFGIAKLKPGVDLSSLSFPDPEGNVKSLGAPEFAGKARIIELFGTWCPNCRDETALLKELNAKYKERGLSILSLAFEVTGDAARDAKQVKIYEKRMGVTWPVLIAGTNQKEKAAAAFPVLESIPGYPTTLFVDGTGKVRAVYVGFSGPATGVEYTALRGRFEKLIETMLSE